MDGVFRPKVPIQFQEGVLPAFRPLESSLLDPYTTGLTGAWSFGRKLLTSYSGSFYTASGGLITDLHDQSGNARDFVQGTASLQPAEATAGGNSRACGDFDGADDFLEDDNSFAIQNLITASAAYTAMSVIIDNFETDDATLYLNMAGWADSAQFVGLFFVATGEVISYYNWDGDLDRADDTGTTATEYVIETRHESGSIYIRINGGTWQSAVSGNTATLAASVFFGSGTAASSQFNGKIFEFVTYNAVPTEAAQNAISSSMMTWIGAT